MLPKRPERDRVNPNMVSKKNNYFSKPDCFISC